MTRCGLLIVVLMTACTSGMPIVTPQMGCAALQCLSCFAIPVCGSVGVPENQVVNHERPPHVVPGEEVVLTLTLESRDEPFDPRERFSNIVCRYRFVERGDFQETSLQVQSVDLVESLMVSGCRIRIPLEASFFEYRFYWNYLDDPQELEELIRVPVVR